MQKAVKNPAGHSVNFSELFERVENDIELLRDLLTIFRRDFPHHLRALQEAVARKEMKQVQSTSHTLKGMCANLAMARASSAAAHLEQIGRIGECAGLEDALALFEREVAISLSELDAYLQEAQR